MKLRFTKMHGIGNDFVVIDAISQHIALSPGQIKRISNRNFGIGCDQVLLVEPAINAAHDFRYRIFNADGGEVEQCGNGARCFVRFVHEQGLTQKTEIVVETARGLITLKLEDNGQVTVNMGAPNFEPAHIPFIAESRSNLYSLELPGSTVSISAVSMGNPHAVQIVHDVENVPVLTQGKSIESAPRFPERVNAGFMQVLDTHHIKLRVFERGSGETLACGSGACAAVVSGIQLGLLQSPVIVKMRGGDLSIRWAGENQPVWMTGSAETVFVGEIDI